MEDLLVSSVSSPLAQTPLTTTLAASIIKESPWWLAPTPLALLGTVLLALSVPLLLHLIFFRSDASRTLPTFMLVGPSGSGKTALLTLIERGTSATTCMSQAPKTIEASVPVDCEVASNRYRSANDPSTSVHKKFLLTDTPGHGKLRHHALNMMKTPQNLKGIMFIVDSTALSAESGGLKDVAEYLYDVLLDLQTSRSKSAKSGSEFPVLIVVNKLDLFTALPADMARSALEEEITKMRVSRSRGIQDVSVKTDKDGEVLDDEEGKMKKWLGLYEEGSFSFDQMEDAGVLVSFEGSKLQGQQGDDIQALWTWMGNQL